MKSLAMSVNGFPEQTPGLQGCSLECLERRYIGLVEGQAPVGQIVLLAKVLHNRRNAPQMAPWQPGEQMVLELELQPTVEPIHPWVA